MINERIEKLRNIMKEKGIFAYIIPSADYHQSEYVGEFFKGRQYISGFTGSAGTVVVTPQKAILWTDGRYFLQAEEQLASSCVELYKMGQENVPTTFEYIEKEVPEGSKIGFDGRAISAAMGTELEVNLAKKNKLNYAVDIYPMYGSDVSAALRGGNDIRGALIGPGVHASHGMERTHVSALENTIKLLTAYLV